MRGNQLISGVLIISTVALIASNIYLHTELINLKASTDQPPGEHLSQHDVIALVDDRLSPLISRLTETACYHPMVVAFLRAFTNSEANRAHIKYHPGVHSTPPIIPPINTCEAILS